MPKSIKNGEGRYCSKNCMYNGEIRGNKNRNWQGGISNKPKYGDNWTSKLREQIRQRDNFTCQECGTKQKEIGYKLDIHHIDFNKFNNKYYNLISLCKSCHCKTNYHRNNWIKYYTKKVEKIVK